LFQNEINESIATVRKTTACLFRFNELQSHCAKTAVIVFVAMIKVNYNETCEVFDCKVIETRLQVGLSYFYYLHASFTCRIFSANNYSNWRRFWSM